jgi:hypothetical protein
MIPDVKVLSKVTKSFAETFSEDAAKFVEIRIVNGSQ